MVSIKKCASCQNNYDLRHFNKQTKRKDGLHPWCKSCCRDWRKANKDKLVETNRKCRLKKPELYAARARKNLLASYGMTNNDYNMLLIKQGMKCAICKLEEAGGQNNRFHVDHCHITGRVRGLLCHHCNKGLGQLKDSKTVLLTAINYLDNNYTEFVKKGKK